MKSRSAIIAVAWLLLVAAAPKPRPAAELSMSCHELFNGRPSDHASFYTVKGDKLVRHDPWRSGIVSSAGKMLFLSRTTDKKGPEESFARHVLKGHVLVRTVYRRRPGQKLVKAFDETYDFRKQTIVDTLDREDSCHHNPWPIDEEETDEVEPGQDR
jgi:hypothetical protein